MTDHRDDLGAIERLTDAELVEAAQGCTEQTCLYHGPVNQERARRAPADPKGGGDRG